MKNFKCDKWEDVIKRSKIDRSRPFKHLKKYFDQCGGIVRVHHTGNNCATEKFMLAIEHEFVSSGESRICIVIDCLDDLFRSWKYFVKQFHAKLPIRLSIPGEFADFGEEKTNFNCFNNINAGENVNITIESAVFELGRDESDYLKVPVLKSIGESVFAQMNHGRIMLIVCEPENNPEIVSWLDTSFQNIRDFFDRGLLIVHMKCMDLVKGDNSGFFEGYVDTTTGLTHFLDEDDIQEAISDTKNIICEIFPHIALERATDMAEVLVSSNTQDIREIYNGLSAWIYKLSKNQGVWK